MISFKFGDAASTGKVPELQRFSHFPKRKCRRHNTQNQRTAPGALEPLHALVLAHRHALRCVCRHAFRHVLRHVVRAGAHRSVEKLMHRNFTVGAKLQVLRLFRLARVLKMLRAVPSLRVIIDGLVKGLSEVGLLVYMAWRVTRAHGLAGP